MRAVHTKGNTTTVTKKYPIQEVPKTGGDDFGVVTVIGTLGKGERLRLQVETFEAGAHLVYVDTDVIFE
jgi:hypothetical protein